MQLSQESRQSQTLTMVTIRCQLWGLMITTMARWGCLTSSTSQRSRVRTIQIKSKISCTKDWLKSMLSVSRPRMMLRLTLVSMETERDLCKSLELQAVSWTPHLRMVHPPRKAVDVSLKAGKTPMLMIKDFLDTVSFNQARLTGRNECI